MSALRHASSEQDVDTPESEFRYTKLVIIETHDPSMTNHFMNDLTESI